MKKLIVVLALAVLGFVGAIALAGDLGGEVVVLTTFAKGGNPHQTKLWVVDDNRQVWIRAGQPDSEWFRRLSANPMVSLERDGRRVEYRAVVVPKQRERINRLMAERYGWADQLIGIVRDSNETQPVRLDPVR
jgi:hypothetical protein